MELSFLLLVATVFILLIIVSVLGVELYLQKENKKKIADEYVKAVNKIYKSTRDDIKVQIRTLKRTLKTIQEKQSEINDIMDIIDIPEQYVEELNAEDLVELETEILRTETDIYGSPSFHERAIIDALKFYVNKYEALETYAESILRKNNEIFLKYKYFK